jgi:GMP synthase-like glutamine amidotransferase
MTNLIGCVQVTGAQPFGRQSLSRRQGMTNKILIVKHVEQEGAGKIEDFFRADGWDLTTVELGKGQSLPASLDDIGAMVILGGPMNVYEEERYPFLKDEDKLITRALVEEIPLLGICLGAQLLAKACGASVTKAPVKEAGYYPVETTVEGARDRLFKGFEKELIVFQWHEDTFEIPEGGILLVEGPTCTNQAFRVGSSGYGLQFHIEVTPAMVKQWMEDEKGSLNVQEIIQYSQRLKDRLEAEAHQLCMNFKELIESTLRVKRLMQLFAEGEKKRTKKVAPVLVRRKGACLSRR